MSLRYTQSYFIGNGFIKISTQILGKVMEQVINSQKITGALEATKDWVHKL